MADATHFMCLAAVRGEKLRCLADIVSQTSRAASGASAGTSADGRRRLLPIVVVANTRDAVDAAMSAVLAVAPRARVARLHSDQSADERAATMEGFRAASSVGLDERLRQDAEGVGDGVAVLFAADACLPSVATGEAPLRGVVLMQLEVPRVSKIGSSEATAQALSHHKSGPSGEKAEGAAAAYRRRVRAALGADAGFAVSVVSLDERHLFDAASRGFEVEEAPFDLHDVVVARWRGSARGKEAR